MHLRAVFASLILGGSVAHAASTTLIPQDSYGSVALGTVADFRLRIAAGDAEHVTVTLRVPDGRRFVTFSNHPELTCTLDLPNVVTCVKHGHIDEGFGYLFSVDADQLGLVAITEVIDGVQVDVQSELVLPVSNRSMTLEGPTAPVKVGELVIYKATLDTIGPAASDQLYATTFSVDWSTLVGGTFQLASASIDGVPCDDTLAVLCGLPPQQPGQRAVLEIQGTWTMPGNNWTLEVDLKQGPSVLSIDPTPFDSYVNVVTIVEPASETDPPDPTDPTDPTNPPAPMTEPGGDGPSTPVEEGGCSTGGASSSTPVWIGALLCCLRRRKVPTRATSS